MIYSIAELFHSIQGEGAFTGTPMFFVRLAGCNVGEYAKQNFTPTATDFPLFLDKTHSVCTSAGGTEFLCDTEYRVTEHRSAEELVAMLFEHHVCITGGEPFLHDLAPLVKAFQSVRAMCHIETSGTLRLQFSRPVDLELLWITCAPKIGFDPRVLYQVDEVKLLVSPTTTTDHITDFLGNSLGSLPPRIYLQPINGVNECWEDSLTRCLELLREFPQLKLSAQLHKYLHQR